MKKYFMPLVVLLLTAGTSCKKDNQGYQSPAQPPAEKKWVVTTIAGDGTPSFTNGPALSATFHFPEDVAVAADGTIYVTDVVNRVIRKIKAGQVSTFAGGGFDIINGNGTSASFKNPYSVTIDANGNLYTSDENDPRIRKISSGADVTTYAGLATEGYADGDADTARFFSGNSIVADAQGNVYLSDASIRKISVSGQVTTIAGTTQFGSPGGIAIDKNGNLYVVDRGNYRIRKITPEGDVSTVAGNGTPGDKDGNADEAQFSIDTHDIVVDDQGNLYLADNNRIRKITPQGIVSTIAGSTAGFADGIGAQAKFNFPNGLGIDAQGNIYVADLNNHRIRKISFE
ncbi:MAG: NHL repeat-containing protein [Bacteroidota bacterium]|nr:NHL repeat-containing protein [Bacteroidota bacterium]